MTRSCWTLSKSIADTDTSARKALVRSPFVIRTPSCTHRTTPKKSHPFCMFPYPSPYSGCRLYSRYLPWLVPQLLGSIPCCLSLSCLLFSQEQHSHHFFLFLILFFHYVFLNYSTDFRERPDLLHVEWPTCRLFFLSPPLWPLFFLHKSDMTWACLSE